MFLSALRQHAPLADVRITEVPSEKGDCCDYYVDKISCAATAVPEKLRSLRRGDRVQRSTLTELRELGCRVTCRSA
jgi:hypothetical protein